MKNISTASSEELMLQARGYCSLNALFPKTTGCVVFSAEDGKNSLTKFVINDQELYSHRVRITSLGIMDVLLFTDNFGVGFKVLFTEAGREITATFGNGDIKNDVVIFSKETVDPAFINANLQTRFDAAHRYILGKMQAYPAVVLPSSNLFSSNLLDGRLRLLERCSIHAGQIVASQGRDPRYFIAEDYECLPDKRLMIKAQARHKPFGFGL